MGDVHVPNTSPLHSINSCMITLDEIKLIIQKCEPEPAATASASTAHHARPGPWQNAKQKARWVIEKDQVERLLADLEKHKTMVSMAVTKESMSSIIQILRKQDDACRTLNEIQKTQSEIHADHIRNTERSLSTERRKILDDMSKLQPRVTFNKHRSIRTEGTGIAFLKSSEFANFDKNPNSRLWLYGIPGGGKSVLSAAIIEHFEKQRTAKVASAYFFCEYADKATQSCRNILDSLVRQLVLQSEHAFEDLLDFYKSHTTERKSDFEPEDEDLLSLLKTLSENFETTIITIDGLDECLTDRGRTVSCLAKLSGDGPSSIKTLFTSREEIDIKASLGEFQAVAIAASEADVRLFVAAELKTRFKRLCERDPDLSVEILNVLVKKSEGMFQWVKCQLDHLERLAKNKERRKALQELPPSLPETYRRILLRAINNAEHLTMEFVRRTLRWVTLAKTPFSVRRMAHAISVDIDECSFDETLDINMVLGLRSSLVQEVNGLLHFSHFSVREFLREINPEDTELVRFRIQDSESQILGKVCLTYLLLKDFDRQGFVKPSDLRPDDFEEDYVSSANGPYPSYPLYGYAALFWIDHTEANAFYTVISNLRSQLFDAQKTDQYLFWAHACISNSRILAEYASLVIDHIHEVTPLHLACSLGIADLVDQLIREGANVNQNSYLLGSTLECAIRGLEFSVDVENPWEPIDDARHQTIRRLLRENAISSDNFDPIACAIHHKDSESVQILLEHGFPLESGTMSLLSSTEDVHELLLDLDADDLQPHVQRSIQTALSLYGVRDSARSGDKNQCSEILVHSYQDYMTAIKQSSVHGHIQPIENLLPRLQNLSADEISEFLSHCLIEAAERGHGHVSKFLMESGASPTFQRSSDGRTALHVAARGGRIDVVRSILQRPQFEPSSLDVKDSKGFTPWMCAIRSGSVEVLMRFRDVSSAINLHTITKNDRTTAHLAAEKWNLDMTLYLLGNGVDFSKRDAHGKTPVHVFFEGRPNFAIQLSACQSAFRVLQQHDNLCQVTPSGQNTLHFLARSESTHIESLQPVWWEIRYDSTFDAIRGPALATADKEKDTPLHTLLRRIAENINQSPSSPGFRGLISLVQAFSEGNDDERLHLHMRDKHGCIPIMSFAKALSEIDACKKLKHEASATILNILNILSNVQRSRRLHQEKDYEEKTFLHHVAICGTNFPFQEVTDFFLKSSCNVAMRDVDGAFPLTLAAP